MSFQLSILKILAGQPDGRATVTRVKQYLEIFYTSGPEWTARMRALAERAPDLDVFSQKLIERAPGEWIITDEGRAFLQALERPQSEVAKAVDSVPAATEVMQLCPPVVASPRATTTVRQHERRTKRAARRERGRRSKFA